MLAVSGLYAGSQTVFGDDASSSGRYKILSSPSGQYIETLMLDKQTGRVWMMRGQVSDAPYLITCVYQMVNGGTGLSPLDEGSQSETSDDRFTIKSATGSQYAETYILDKQNGRVWMLRGQVSQGPYLIPCVYQLSNLNTALSPLSSFTPKDRFSITCVANGSVANGGYPETYVNDIQTGAIWKMRGQVSKAPFLIPCIYQLVNGETASSPMERHREIDLLGKTAPTTTSIVESQPPPANDIHSLAKQGDLAKVKALIKDNPDLVFSKDENGAQPLHGAAFGDQKEVADFLLDNKASVNAKNNYGLTPLHVAAIFGHKDMAGLLIAKGADVNAKDKDGHSPLYYALDGKYEVLAELLRQHGGNQ